ncbi:hypothetical protein ACFQZX_06900 [Mucilaginibacter litoreus]|uniref:Uncharacterized protein n=1 Tax=Mucilaginibacter litoreus TaxID=1048221 RepID=A0ABW3AR55_9SPHI
MMKLFNTRAFFLVLLILGNMCIGHAQDTTKKNKPTVTEADKKTTLTNKNYYKKPIATPAQKLGNGSSLQVPPAPKPEADKSLRGQYKYLLTKVYNYQQPLVAALFKNYTDTLNATRKQLKQAQETLAKQTKAIDTLKASASSKDQSLAESQAKVDEVSLLGIPLTKATYNWIMWGLVIGFGVIAIIVIARSGTYSREAKYRVKLYNELDEEYRNYKAKANEKEKKLARELQTERNKLDELMGRG